MTIQHKKNNKPSQATRADKHKLYENSVQNVKAEIDFIDNTFQALRKRKASALREDFCGTANTSCEWVRRRSNNHAYGVDLDDDVQNWSRQNTLTKVSPAQRKRITLLNANVLNVKIPEPLDIVLAMNFSYWIFKERQTMVHYFKRVYSALRADGVFFLDAFGGYESTREMTEVTDFGRFKYIWDQSKYNPINGHGLFKIHYKFPDGSRLKDAFTYDWRVWTLPEISEMLIEAGFKPTVYWEGTDKHNEGNGVFTAATEGEADAGWIVYISAEK